MPKKPSSPAAALDASLSALEGCWLDLRCCKTTIYPLRLMAKRHGGEIRLREALARLRCKRCGGRPASVTLLETALTEGKGRPRGWRIELALPGPSG